jgi:hypothetical protein
MLTVYRGDVPFAIGKILSTGGAEGLQRQDGKADNSQNEYVKFRISGIH